MLIKREHNTRYTCLTVLRTFPVRYTIHSYFRCYLNLTVSLAFNADGVNMDSGRVPSLGELNIPALSTVLLIQFLYLLYNHFNALFRSIRDFTNQNATHFENTETEKGPGREHRHEPREKQSYGCERDDRGRAKLR